MHGPQERTPWYEMGAPPNRTTNKCDDQDELVPDGVCRCNKVVFEDKYSCIENEDGNQTELVLQSNVYWLKANLLNEKADSVEMRAPEDQAKRTHHSASSVAVS